MDDASPKKTALVLVAVLGILGLSAGAAEFHVSPQGDDGAAGSAAAPWRTIQRAARVATAGDVVTIHAGVYREWVKPAQAGREGAPIVYRAAPGEKVVITGADEVRGWTKRADGLWEVRLAYDTFGGFNPFTDALGGMWYRAKRPVLRTRLIQAGRRLVLHDREAFVAKEGLAAVLKVGHAALLAGPVSGTIVARFAQDPSVAVPELVVRPACFYPLVEFRDYQTLRGLSFVNAGPTWGSASAQQVGVVGTHWSRGWVIEDCTVSGSSADGISLGKHGDAWDNAEPETAPAFVKTIKRAEARGMARTGHHTIRRCTITDCAECGIHGALGCNFAVVEDCWVSYCNWKQPYNGTDNGGIKFLGSVDSVIARNHIHHCGPGGGIWLDWMAQGARVTENVLWCNDHDLFVEVSYGPVLVEGNAFLSSRSVRAWSQGLAFVGNRIWGNFELKDELARSTPIFEPHSLTVRAHEFAPVKAGGYVFINNILARPPDFKRTSIPSRFERENNWIVPPANWKGDESNGNAWVRAPKDNPPPAFKPVTPERLGAAPAINQPYPAPTVSEPNLASW